MEIFLVILLAAFLIILGNILKHANETIYHIYVILKMAAVIVVLYIVDIGEVDFWGMQYESSDIIASLITGYLIWMIINVIRKARLI